MNVEVKAQMKKNLKFVIILKKEIGKYNGKFPFKCFNYGRVGHYASKFPFKKEEKKSKHKEKNKYRIVKNDRKFKMESLYTQENSSSSEDTNGSFDEEVISEFMLMALESKN